MEQPNRIINVAGDYVQSKHVDYEINPIPFYILHHFLSNCKRVFEKLRKVHD